jgi:hypothetical protein
VFSKSSVGSWTPWDVALSLGWGRGQSTDLAGEAGDFPCSLIPMHNAFAHRFAQRPYRLRQLRGGGRHIMVFYRRYDFFYCRA